MNIAIEGCLHGELAEVYKQLTILQKNLQVKIDLLIICGDFQSLRHEGDLEDMHCPPKYKSMGSFHNYLQGDQTASILTVFIGGNHEAVNSLRQLYFGGWVAKNIYYLGQAGSIFVRKGLEKIRITGCSGIYNHHDFKYLTRTELCPLRGKDKISAYHTKQLELYRMEILARIGLMKLQNPSMYGQENCSFDIFMSHDWPKNIALYGNTNKLYKYKPFIRKQVDQGTFGSPPMFRLMQLMKPSYWFSAHMHIKYAALFPHPGNQFTHFLSLDKCLDKRLCLQVLSFGEKTQGDVSLEVDREWLTVIHMTQSLHREEQSLYYYDKMELKLKDPKKMNQILKAYPQIHKDLGVKSSLVVPYEEDQLEQTRKLIQKVRLTPQMFKGIIFPRAHFEEFSKERASNKHSDEIQIDL